MGGGIGNKEAGLRRDNRHDGKAEAVAHLMLESAQCFFRIRAFGQRMGLVTDWGAGAFGFLRTLRLLGPMTVPDIAKLRPTSRQRMQRLADELATEGLVEFFDNPKHRRSKLVRLTASGESRYSDMSNRLLSVAATIGDGLSEASILKSIEVLQQLGRELTERP